MRSSAKIRIRSYLIVIFRWHRHHAELAGFCRIVIRLTNQQDIMRPIVELKLNDLSKLHMQDTLLLNIFVTATANAPINILNRPSSQGFGKNCTVRYSTVSVQFRRLIKSYNTVPKILGV